MHSKCLRFTLGLLLLASWAGAATLDEMVNDLAGPDDLAQARARQLLPRKGYPAAEKLLPVLANPEERVWRAAQNVLNDIANEATIPGREAEQAELSALFATLVAPGQPEAIKIRGLDLLTIVVADKGDVKPIAALLSDPALKERARAALEGIGTPKACAALRGGLGKADPEFQAALLDSLAICRDAKSVSAAKRYLKSGDPRVRAVAARAVAWTADPRFVEPLRGVRASSDQATHFDATDALLRLGDALACAGSRAEAAAVYTDVVKTEANPALAGAALASLIRYGDASAAAEVSAALSGDKRAQFQPAALAAFEALRGETGNALLLAVYPTVAPDLRQSLLGSMGRKHDAVYQDTLAKAIADPALRVAAANALADSRQPGAAYVISNALVALPEGERAPLQEALQRMAKSCHDDGNQAIASQAYLALYRVADGPGVRQDALENLMQYPVAEALDVVVPALERGELVDAQPAAFLALAESLAKANRPEDAGRVAGAMASRAKTTDAVMATLRAAQASKGAGDVPARLGFVMKWFVVGPFAHDIRTGFQKNYIGEPAVDTNATFTDSGKTLKWTPIEGAPDSGIVDFSRAFGVNQNTVAYAYTKVTVPADTDAVFRAGSDDGIKIWVNGQVVHENLLDRGTAIDDDEAPVKLKAGNNDILVEVNQGGGGWAFVLRLTRPDGTPVTVTQ